MRLLLTERLTVTHRLRTIELSSDDGAGRAWIHAHGNVEAESRAGNLTTLAVRLSDADFARYQRR